MSGDETRIPVDLMYGTAEPESASYGEYATKLQESLSKAYTLARESLAHNRKIHGTPHAVGALVWLLTLRCPEGNPRNFTGGGQDHLRS